MTITILFVMVLKGMEVNEVVTFVVYLGKLEGVYMKERESFVLGIVYNSSDMEHIEERGRRRGCLFDSFCKLTCTFPSCQLTTM